MMRNRKYIILYLVILLIVICGNLSAMNIAYIVGDTTSLGSDTLFIQRMENYLGYAVSLIDDNAVDTFSNWSNLYDGIFISDRAISSYLGALRDTAVGLMTIDRYTNDEFGFGNTYSVSGGHGRDIVNLRNNNHVCDMAADSLFFYQYENQYFYFYGDLSEAAIVPFNTVDMSGHDSACVIMLDSGAAMEGGGVTSARRVFCGAFRLPYLMDYCQSWNLFDRLTTWAFDDTANVGLKEYQCWGGHLEIDACWGEVTSGSNDSATYNSEFRFGYDEGDILEFWRLIHPERKSPAGYGCDSLVLEFPVFLMIVNGTPEDTVMNIRYGAYRIIRSEKWHGPPPDNGGDPYALDSTWVTRWDVIAGSSPTAWDTLDLRAGVDYNAAVLDTFQLDYPADSTGDFIRFVIPGEVFDLWADDTANNNGLVFKAETIYDSLSNIEYLTRAPIDNVSVIPMTVQAWFSPVSDTSIYKVAQIIGVGILSDQRFNVIN